MNMTANLHHTELMRAMCSPCGTAAWLSIKNESGNEVAVFMPFQVAVATAKAFTEAMAALQEAVLA